MTDRLSLDALPSPYLRPKLSIDNESKPFDAAGRAPDLPARKRELEALYRSHGSRVVGYFQRQGQSEQAAHDLTQETFVNAWRAALALLVRPGRQRRAGGDGRGCAADRA